MAPAHCTVCEGRSFRKVALEPRIEARWLCLANRSSIDGDVKPLDSCLIATIRRRIEPLGQILTSFLNWESEGAILA